MNIQKNENLRKMLYSRISEIKNLDIRKFAKEVLDNAPEGFWTTPCSGSGKYHPPENQGNGGLIRHLLKCVIIAKDLCKFMNLSERDKDIVLASAILHDIKKNGDPWGKTTDMEHGKLGAEFLNSFKLKEPEKTEIKNCVRYHLGRFTGTKGDIGRASNLNKNELVVYLTDIFCSRKYASWLPNINLSVEKINNFPIKFQTDLNCF